MMSGPVDLARGDQADQEWMQRSVTGRLTLERNGVVVAGDPKLDGENRPIRSIDCQIQPDVRPVALSSETGARSSYLLDRRYGGRGRG